MPGTPRARTAFAPTPVLALLLMACTPAHDWRELRLGSQGLVVLLPCRAQHDERRLRLADTEVTMRLAACTAAGRTWAAAEVELAPGQPAEPLLAALLDAARRNVAASEATPLATAAAGTSPSAGAGRWNLLGKRPDGQPLQMQLGLLHQGRSVVQLTVLGPTPAPADALESFFGAPRWPR